MTNLMGSCWASRDSSDTWFTILTLPSVEGRDADVRFPADGRCRLAALRPAQDRYDLLRGVSFSFSFWHLGPFLAAQSLLSDGSVRVSQVKITTSAISTAVSSTSGAGIYDITLTGGSAANYTLTLIDGALTIGKATILVTANDQTRTFGSANPALTYRDSGFVNRDRAGVSGAPSLYDVRGSAEQHWDVPNLLGHLHAQCDLFASAFPLDDAISMTSGKAVGLCPPRFRSTADPRRRAKSMPRTTAPHPCSR